MFVVPKIVPPKRKTALSKSLGFKFAEQRPEEKALSQLEQEFKTAWRWFFHKIFFDSLQGADFADFVRDTDLALKYTKIFKGIDGSEDKSFLSWFPRLKDGNVKLK